MSEKEQNMRINQIRRQLSNAVERIKTLQLDIDSRLDPMEHQFNRLQEKLEVILEALR
ncbi:hypothetical protein [Gloeocapsa sp. PCC 73106]|uniref:hypothetical protein n=1 Tax=Gloeocapsa sp. PCC 73106 TaxID=102232 RepID=UPI0002ABB039|nr:hypothetical protein [Gloeocapsa sp. PCC 73106]ELR99568.1 hypothetical protein GLO73106DRAFT_00034200 [Gloeocapsa sp. PCC 73106]